MSEAQVEQEKPKFDITVVDSGNFNDYVDEKLAPSPEQIAAEELAAIEDSATPAVVEEPKENTETKEEKPKKGKKDALNERFSELTSARKAAEEKAAKIEEEAKAEREARRKAEQDAAALRAKYEPPKSNEIGPKPEVHQFTDINEYSKALEDWASDKAIKEESARQIAAAQEREAQERSKRWLKNVEDTKKEIPDYEKAIQEASSLQVSNEVRDAIHDSEVGPKILHYLATHQEFTEKLGQMPVRRSLREIYKIEASFSSENHSEGPKTSVAEISKAPPPITPLKNANAPAVVLKATDEVPAGMTYDTWKKLYLAGRIR